MNPTNTKDTQKKSTRTAEQNAQARLVLIQLLWLFVVLIIAAMVWLYNNQKKMALYVEERLAITKNFDSRMNDIDDRIFALMHTPETSKDESTVQSNNELIFIQLGVVNRLYQGGDYQSATQMLHLIKLQLSNPKFTLASSIKSALQSAINDDLTALNTLQKTTDPYQEDAIQLQEAQSQLRAIIETLPKLKLSANDELSLRDGAILISLALSASAAKDRPTMVVHLKESLYHLSKPVLEEPDAKISLDTVRHTLKTLIDSPPTLPPLKSVILLQDTPKS